MKERLIKNLSDLEDIQSSILEAASKLVERMKQPQSELDILADLKFNRPGFDPLEPENNYNIIEQTNQTFSYLVAIKGIRYLFRSFPGDSFLLNYGTNSGPDIRSSTGRITQSLKEILKDSSRRRRT